MAEDTALAQLDKQIKEYKDNIIRAVNVRDWGLVIVYAEALKEAVDQKSKYINSWNEGLNTVNKNSSKLAEQAQMLISKPWRPSFPEYFNLIMGYNVNDIAETTWAQDVTIVRDLYYRLLKNDERKARIESQTANKTVI